MAGSLNKVLIIGNLGRDPEIRATQGGGKVATLNVATSESWVKDGERKESTEWHRCILFGKGAETAEKYLKKGSKAFFEGRLQTRKWEDKATGQEKYATEVVVDRFTMLDAKKTDEVEGTHSARISNDVPFDDSEGVPF